MRSISLVPKLEVDYKGSLFKNAVCLADIDDDGGNELCVGFTNGELHAYKGLDTTKPWKLSRGLGSLVVLCSGHIRSNDETLLCALDSEGRCNLFDAGDHFNAGADSQMSEVDGSFVGSHGSRPSSPNNELRLVHKEELSPNAKVAILEDIDNDGVEELIIGYTDRYVRIYKWSIQDGTEETMGGHGKPSEHHPTTPQSTFTKQGSNENADKKSTLSFSLSMSKEPKQQQQPHHQKSTESFASTSFGHSNSHHCHPVGRFVLLKQFSLLSQIGSLAVCTVEGLNQLIVSQPNGGYCILGQYDQEAGFTENVSTPTTPNPCPDQQQQQQDSYPVFYPISNAPVAGGSKKNHQQHINTEIIGGIKRQNKNTGVIGLCTHDGSFIILDNSHLSSKSYHTPAKNQSTNNWFAISKLDVTNDGDDEIVLCDLRGMTYIIDKERNVVSYNFNESVAAFCAGFYGTGCSGRATPCLCYVTLSGKIHLYYDVFIDAIQVRCVHAALIEKITEKPELHYLLDLFKGRDNGEVDHEKLQTLVKHSCSLKHKV